MENLIYSAEILLPIIILIIFGYLLQKLKLFSEEFLRVSNKLIFKVFFPIMLFYNIFSENNIIDNINYQLLLFVISIVLGFYLLLFLIVPRLIKDNKRKGVMIQGMFSSNFLLFGIPLVGAANILTISIVAAIYIPFVNILANIALYTYSEDESKSIKKAVYSSLTNPLVIGGMLGISFGILRNYFDLSTPSVIDKPTSQIVGLATPFAFILLGGGLGFKNLLKNIKFSLPGSLTKIVILPAIILPLAYLIGFNQAEYSIIIAIAATPNVVISYSIARNYKADYELAGEMIVLSTVISLLTIFIILSVSLSLGLIAPII